MCAYWLGMNASVSVKFEKNVMMQKQLELSDIPGSWNVQNPVSNSFGHSQTKLELCSHKKSLIQLFADELIWWILKGEL